MKSWPIKFTRVYPNALAIMGAIGVFTVTFTLSVPESLHTMAFDFTVPYALSSASMALVFAKRSAGADRFSLNSFALVLMSLGSTGALVAVADLAALVNTVDPEQLFSTFGIGLIASLITVASAFANESGDDDVQPGD